jgi:hypothetical protein
MGVLISPASAGAEATETKEFGSRHLLETSSQQGHPDNQRWRWP